MRARSGGARSPHAARARAPPRTLVDVNARPLVGDDFVEELPVGAAPEIEHIRPTARFALASLGRLFPARVSGVLLAKALAPAIGAGIGALGAPIALVGVVIAAIVLLPECASALRAAAGNRLQSSINLSLGSAVATIGLSVPVIAAVSEWQHYPLALGISAGDTVLMTLGFGVAIITYGTGRTTLLAGIVHLVLLATWVFTIFAP